MQGGIRMTFQKIDIKDLNMNAFQAIGKDWMLITAGDQSDVNTMTASWGGIGVLWGTDVVTAYIRPQRYTKEFVDQQKCFSLSLTATKKNLVYLAVFQVEMQTKSKMLIFTSHILKMFQLLKRLILSLLLKNYMKIQ